MLTSCAAAAVEPDLIGKDPAQQSLLATLESLSLAHPLGTDHLGRDMAARLLSGAQLSLSLAFLSVITAGLPGTFLGVAAVWYEGWTDRIIGAFADAVLALPGLLLVLMLAAISWFMVGTLRWYFIDSLGRILPLHETMRKNSS